MKRLVWKYEGNFTNLTSEMIISIVSDESVTTTDATLSTFEPKININSKIIMNDIVDIKGSLTLPTIGDVEDALRGKQDTIEDGDLTISKTSGLQTALDDKYDDTGGSITGNVNITGDLVVIHRKNIWITDSIR